ncbi:hypothetical protein V6N11_065713 [Hibiscus sabdariffa]|uniref:Uncharacterized protein n=1 Tax=Hibiscus sabdariffa TaxID=183260 RepID=A0ABR2PIG9_9ROSI
MRVIEATLLSINPTSSQDNVSIHPVSSQDSAQRSRTRRALPWKNEADDEEVQECSNGSLKDMHNFNTLTSIMPSTSAVLKGKSEGKKKTKKVKRPSHESDIDCDDIVAFSQLFDVPKIIIDRFDDE